MNGRAVDRGAIVGWGIALGLVAGLTYTLTPMTVLAIVVITGMVRWCSRDLSVDERRWFLVLIVVAIAARLVLIGGLCLSADAARPYATFFGDEELFKSRSLWIRNMAYQVPISPADVIYSVDETGWSSYLYVLAFLQALVGNAPYGVHVFNATVYLASALILYRLARASFGGLAAMGGLAILLYLPSLFFWSISALKEPLYTLIGVIEMLCAIRLARGPRAWHRAIALVAIVALAWALEGVRKGGASVALAASATGVFLAAALPRPRLLIASTVAIPLLVAAVMSRPAVQAAVLYQVKQAAIYHAGHLSMGGYAYTILDQRYYDDRGRILYTLSHRDAANFVAQAVIKYVVEPLPWKGDSQFLRAFLPEQVIWWVLFALVPFGVIAAARSDLVLTMLLAAHAAMIMFVVALASGNAGTLVRHRGLALPYLVWFSALGAISVARVLIPRASNLGLQASGPTHGDR